MSEETTPIVAAILPSIKDSRDVKNIPVEQLPTLCHEIRKTLVEKVTKCGGHLASNLGVVELTVAIHRVFDSLHDHIIFDVGHQSYVHKMLTGRCDQFDSLRRPGGLSGFPKREESPHDAFGTGHASTSLSAGLGFAQADLLDGKDDFTIVVLGDGAFTGGMIHEALNNCSSDLKLILIINENEMSISKNIGHFAQELAQLRSRPAYLRTKTAVEKILEHIPLIGKPTRRLVSGVKNAVKESLYGSNYFENMGLRYLGPADGNNLSEVETLLRRAKNGNRACVIHLKTVKGKGYEPAMRAPSQYHALPPARTGDTAAQNETTLTFSQTFGQTLTALASKDERLCAITAAMQHGTGLIPFAKAYPNRLFDVGIAEEHAVTFAAGLCAQGYHPVVAIYSTFLQRSYDNILHDVALQKLPVMFCIDRAGLNAADGPTHHGIFDVAFLMHVPGMRIYEPYNTQRLSELLCALQAEGYSSPVAIRYPSGKDDLTLTAHFSPDKRFSLATGSYCDFDPETPPSTLILTYGRICGEAIRAKNQYKSPERVGIVYIEKLFPHEELLEYLDRILRQNHPPKKLIFLEEGILRGGLAMNLSFALQERLAAKMLPDIRTLAIRDSFCVQTENEPIFATARIDAASILYELEH
ncbi:MAG: 1-deoxy-D-xylulose-5-phosphate synthase [Clostridia bacterium]|nr:1-deoxy-D-xylulose-5-phosphate synthase [Clostridia bacterium]